MKSPLRRRIAAAALVVAAPVAAGCTNGFGAQTDQVYRPAIGTNDKTGDVDALSAVIVSGTDGSGTLSVTLLNNADKADSLVAVRGSDISATFSPIELPSHEPVNLSEEGQVSVSGAKVDAGNFVRIELVFGNGDTKEMLVPVETPDPPYEDVPLPSGDSSSSPSASASATSE